MNPLQMDRFMDVDEDATIITGDGGSNLIIVEASPRGQVSENHVQAIIKISLCREPAWATAKPRAHRQTEADVSDSAAVSQALISTQYLIVGSKLSNSLTRSSSS